MNSVLQFKKVNCKNCYKCVRHCPVKSIEVSGHHAQIIERDCILCGNCIVECPQHAKMDISDISKIKEIIRGGKNVIASVAPSFIAYYDLHDFKYFRKALQELHFVDAFETAEGAYLVKSEYERLIEEGKTNTLISSCCSTVNQYIRKHSPEVLPNLAPVITPMQAHSKLIKERYPDSVVVFIGPCVSKKAECQEENSAVDFVITFGELKEWFTENDIVFSQNNRAIDTEEKYLSRLFPVSGGILNTMKKNDDYKYISVCGIDNCIKAIEDVVNGNLPNCFIEMSACEGSCTGGPSFRKHKMSLINAQFDVEDIAPHPSSFEKDYKIETEIPMKTSFADQKTYYMNPTEKQITGILRKMGKNTIEDELNCGMCGYMSCRDKAIAVYFGKADISMCLPFMKERAESFSDKIINVTPNAIIAVDMDLRVQQINKSACEIFGITNQTDILGQPVSRILDEFDFVDMITNDNPKQTKRCFLAEYNVYLEQIFLYDKSNSIIICIMKNITKNKQKQNQIMKAKLHAANMADDIVDKQLRIVHEIASLLGETAAETKVAITELKETIMMDNDDFK